MEIKFNNPLQVHIADLFWEADTEDKVKEILTLYGKEGEVVYNMMLAASFDQFNETDLAEKVIAKVK